MLKLFTYLFNSGKLNERLGEAESYIILSASVLTVFIGSVRQLQFQIWQPF